MFHKRINLYVLCKTVSCSLPRATNLALIVLISFCNVSPQKGVSGQGPPVLVVVVVVVVLVVVVVVQKCLFCFLENCQEHYRHCIFLNLCFHSL